MTATKAPLSVAPSPNLLKTQHAFKLAFSLALLYWLALTLNWDLPKYGALAIVLISLDTTGASLQKGLMRIAGTTVGLAVGMLGLALFAQDSWLTLVYHAAYLLVVAYFMQSSRYPYAWYVAGFLPSLVWATTYGKIENTFSYATFRYLETSAGVVIYTAVSAVIWPRRAGDKLRPQGDLFWTQFRELFGLYRRHFEGEPLPPDVAAKRSKLVGTGSQIHGTLEAAYLDTSSVASQKRAWERFQFNARAVSDAMELWRQSIDDCRELDIDRIAPQIHTALEKIEQRLVRIEQLWQAQSSDAAIRDADDRDESLLTWQNPEVGQDPAIELSHLDRAALLSFVQQLNVMHVASRELLLTMRVLSGLAPAAALGSHPLPTDLYRPSAWDPVRLATASMPAICFALGYVFWIYCNPPTGPSVPNMAATFGLLIVLTPLNATALILPVLIAMGAFVAPVYFLVMPRLSTGPELLALVFGFAFTVTVLLNGRLAMLRTLVLVMFVMLTGISNDQTYSFNGLVDGGIMFLLALGIIAIVQCFAPRRPERMLMNSVRRFFRGCALVTGAYQRQGSTNSNVGDWNQGRRKRYLRSIVLPAPAHVQAAHRQLDNQLYPDNPPEKMQRLIDALQSTANRLQSVEIAHQRCDAHGLPQSYTPVTIPLRDFLTDTFRRWSSLRSGDEMADQQSELRQLADGLEDQLQQLHTNRQALDIDDESLADLYTMTGSVRGLIEAMVNTQAAIHQINWQQLATPRF